MCLKHHGGISNDYIVAMKHDRHMKQVELGIEGGGRKGTQLIVHTMPTLLLNFLMEHFHSTGLRGADGTNGPHAFWT
jgi:hypothetical protein